MKKNRLYILLFVFIMFFCVNVGGVKADNFTLDFGKNSEKISVRLAGASDTDFNGASSIECEVNVSDDNDTTVSRCSYIGNSAYYNNTYSFKGSGNNNKINVKITNKKNNNNSLRMTNFNASCEKPSQIGNNYICTIANITFKWEKHDECNNPDRSGNNNGIPGVIACVGGSSIFCDKYKNMKDSDLKKECPGAFEDSSSLTVKDVLKKCEILDTASFDKWCKYGNGKKIKNTDIVQSIINAANKWGSEEYGVSSDGSVSCTALLGPENVDLISEILLIISVIGVVLVIIFEIGDFVKAIASSDDDALAQAFKKLKNRIISVVVLLLLPVLVDFTLGFINDNLHYEIVKRDENGNVLKDKDGNAITEDVSIKVGKASDCGQ